MRIPDGAAAVCVRAGCVDESQSLGNWEGKTSDEAEPEELPDFDAIKFLRLMGLRNYLTPFCIYMQKSVLFCFKGKSF